MKLVIPVEGEFVGKHQVNLLLARSEADAIVSIVEVTRLGKDVFNLCLPCCSSHCGDLGSRPEVGSTQLPWDW